MCQSKQHIERGVNMKIKFESKKTFSGEVVLTPCPFRTDGVNVCSRECGSCSFYIRECFFSDAIICSYDKYKKKGQILNDK